MEEFVPIYALGDLVPDIAPDAFIHPDAVLIGSVTIRGGSSVWPGAVLRGDRGRITVGQRTSIQDGSVIHCSAAFDTIIGDECTIGHLVHLEGCSVADQSLIGSGATVLPGASIGRGAVVAAQALVPLGLTVPARALARGVPARVIEGAADPDMSRHAVATYVENAHWYAAKLRRLD
jgi:carbonic anhydrase/acetyltransferase-like protein (isoleucine patch superfamily)